MKQESITIFKVLGDETRLQIVSFLARKKGATCKEISEHFPDHAQPTMSHHFKVLAEAQVVIVTKHGTERHYTLNTPVLERVGILPGKLG